MGTICSTERERAFKDTSIETIDVLKGQVFLFFFDNKNLQKAHP